MSMGTVVGFIDHGELISAQYHWGVSHATGYPLFTLIGYLWSHIPFEVSPVIKLNVLSMLFVLGFLFSAFLTIKQILERIGTFTPFQIASICTIVTAALGAHSIVWQEALSSEVYSLHLLLLIWVVNRLLKAYHTQKVADWYWFSAVLGLSFSNHLTTLLIFPAATYCYFFPISTGFTKKRLVQLFIMAGIAVSLAFSFYGIMVWRAMQNPIINWGNPTSWDSFWFHVLGRQFSNFFVGGKGFGARFVHFVKDSVHLIYLIPIGLWIYKSQKTFRPLTIIGGLTWISCGIFSACYDIHDIDNYYTTGIIGLALLTLGGISYTVQSRKLALVIPLALVIIIGNVVLKYPSVEQRSHISADVLCRKMLNDLPPNAIIITKAWEIFIAPSIYLQTVEGIRKDVLVIDSELLRRDYYKNQLNNFQPNVVNNWEPEYSSFVAEVVKFQYGKKYDPAQLQVLYEAFLAKIVSSTLGKRPLFFTPEVFTDLNNNRDWKMPVGYEALPIGLSIQIVPKNTAYQPDKPVEFDNLHINKKNWFGSEMDIVRLLQSAYASRGKYEFDLGHTTEADSYLTRINSLPEVKIVKNKK